MKRSYQYCLLIARHVNRYRRSLSCWRSAQALEFFGLLKIKALAFEQLFSGNGLWVRWHDKEDVPANISEVPIALRAMGLVFHGSEYGLKDAGLSDDLVQRLCRP
jgi:hypothetical protein